MVDGASGNDCEDSESRRLRVKLMLAAQTQEANYVSIFIRRWKEGGRKEEGWKEGRRGGRKDGRKEREREKVGGRKEMREMKSRRGRR